MSRIRWTKEGAADALAAWAAVHGRPPGKADTLGNGELPSTHTVARLFVTWTAGITAAGLTPPKARHGGTRQPHRRAGHDGMWIDCGRCGPAPREAFRVRTRHPDGTPRAWQSYCEPCRRASARERYRATHLAVLTVTPPPPVAPPRSSVGPVVLAEADALLRDGATIGQAAQSLGVPADVLRTAVGSLPPWTREEAAAACALFAQRAGRTPRPQDWQARTVEHPSAGEVLALFDSWRDLLRKAGLTRREQRGADLPIGPFAAWLSSQATTHHGFEQPAREMGMDPGRARHLGHSGQRHVSVRVVDEALTRYDDGTSIEDLYPLAA